MTAFIMLFQNFQEKHLVYHCISQARERQNQQVVYMCIKKKKTYYKELTHVIVKIGPYKFFRLGWSVSDQA